MRGRLFTRPLLAAALALLTGLSGCYHPWTPHHLDAPTAGKVIVFRGLAGYWPGAVHLKRRLRRLGFDSTTVVMSWEECAIADALIANAECGVPQEPIVIVGYSLGASKAIELCRKLDEAGVPVASLVLIECSFYEAIPPNVARCLNIYESRPLTDWIPVCRGVPLRRESCGTDLENLEVCDDDELAWAHLTHNHFTIATSREVQDLVIEEIRSAVDAWDGDADEFEVHGLCPDCRAEHEWAERDFE